MSFEVGDEALHDDAKRCRATHTALDVVWKVRPEYDARADLGQSGQGLDRGLHQRSSVGSASGGDQHRESPAVSSRMGGLGVRGGAGTTEVTAGDDRLGGADQRPLLEQDGDVVRVAEAPDLVEEAFDRGTGPGGAPLAGDRDGVVEDVA
ncbi:MAG: hypothetical protein R3244_03865 [Thermoanaerobaculia bacterium]|nr:hypothetical protein [Thermoanaerobaculia bacterium]